MKRKKFIALLCVAATSASLVTPVMAEENQAVETVQETAVEQETAGQETTKQEAPAGEVPVEEGAEEKEVPAEEAEEPVEEAALVPEESTAENPENETSEATNTVDTYIEDGLYEENGEVYYYKDGEMLTNKIVEFEAEDGTTFAHYFDYDGTMLKNAYHYYVNWYDDNDNYFAGEIRVDGNGYLCTGWYSEDGYWRYYSEEDYFLCTSEIIEDNGKQYYVDSYGNMVTNTTVMKDGVTYVADSTGVLSVKDMTDKTEWVKSGEDWYLYVDGELVKENYYEYSGKTYYFDQEGHMETGIFEDKTGKRCMAEPSGAVITNPTKGWNKSSEADIWYYYKSNAEGDLYPVDNEMLNLNGKKYYIDWNGRMITGAFYYDGSTYFANTNGEIQEKASWYIDSKGNWYYVKQDGKVVTDDIYKIGNKSYIFDGDGVMQKGTVWYNGKMYLTDNNGAVISTNGWYLKKGDWYYINKDSSIVTDEFKEIDGKLYYFEYDGVMKMGDFYIYDSETGTSKRYYADENGKITRNDWYQAGVDWYYADANGQKETNKWIDETYYLNESGAMVRGTCRIEGIEYFFDNNGKYIGTSAKDGWSYSDGSWFYYKDGEAYTGWVNNKYWVEDGELCTGRFIEDGGKYYYVNCEGIYQTGWIKTEENEWWGEWTYANASGEIVNDGWQSIGGDWYYFKDGVINQFPIIETEDYGACTFKSDGRYTGRAKRSNWYYINEKWYYVKAEGSLARGKETINGHTYYFNSGFTSALLQNEYYSEYDNNSNKSVSVWVNSNGEKDMSNGWKYTGHTYYYVENGAFKNGWLSYGGNWYYLEPGMARGIEFVEYNGEYEYAFFDENGVYHKLTDGWKSIKTEEGFTDWYYVKNGKPASGYVDGYHFYRNGYLDTGIYWSDSGKVYYYDENGKMLKGTGWYLDKYDTWHYIYSDGTMATGERTIGGKKYWFTGYGDWIR